MNHLMKMALGESSGVEIQARERCSEPDLESSRWPMTARPEAHVLLGQVYGDIAGQHAENVAPVHDVDHPELEKQAPALVTDADASQLSAVIDATTGKNLVIQGPPGTGKSQAITNIIANALWHGKTILFVSEKMAALKVVKDRLDHLGLGLYCLESSLRKSIEDGGAQVDPRAHGISSAHCKCARN